MDFFLNVENFLDAFCIFKEFLILSQIFLLVCKSCFKVDKFFGNVSRSYFFVRNFAFALFNFSNQNFKIVRRDSDVQIIVG